MSSFLERQKSLFNHLKDAEEQYSFSKTNKAPATQNFNVVDKKAVRKRKNEMKQFRGKESIFKKPQENLRDCLRARKIPDYMKNPQKWVYYSLSDVTPEQMSDATNMVTAQTFIRELEEQEASKINGKQVEDDFVFKKPTFYMSSVIKKVLKKPKEEDEKVVFKSNKVVMPEYVVGVSQKKEKKQKATKTPQDHADNVRKVELKLQHLFEDEED
ncbi:U5 small nuclear ribonucleoprotein TSSC4 [Ostrinia nubilalis]|uniref:protein TSSC4 n=1 Tax=Ostrinia furnacalis TaxID=93504 RepID=UPI00103D3482|nr:protein TSSC4 [Ostrinia furnacalis]